MHMVILFLLQLLPTAEGGVRTKSFVFLWDSGYKYNWQKAQECCRSIGQELITTRDDIENEKFNHDKGQGWNGLHRENSASKWEWSGRDEEAKFFDWEDGDPVDGKDCAFKNPHEHGQRSDLCDCLHSFKCHKEMLVLVKEKKTWEEALMHCRALEAKDPNKPFTPYQNYKYDLATLITEDDQEFARETTQSATTDEVWTGMRCLAGYWLWVGGEEVMYENINRFPSRGFCGTLPTTGNDSYEIRPCNEKRNFFCYRKSEEQELSETSCAPKPHTGSGA
ncbi:uncharacterized protein LOC117832386 [Notolabrus celidotus]|uniref:uncharacterized protein LOC117832386 n=1 Tax=Notolabrus celidotus TaxID=1203425 RepID=UPI00148FF822|nr:uncharacterized protein LOC117832386 [Notolabrus celidotus]